MIRIPYVKPRLHADGGYRPRWEPGPRQRALGFTATDLKHDDGRWFSLEEAAAYATRMLAKVQARTAAPADTHKPVVPLKSRKSVGDLLDAYFASVDFAEHQPTTRRDYMQKAEAIRWQPRDREERAASVAKIPQNFALAPVSALDKPIVRDFYLYLRHTRGIPMARSVIMVLSAACKWASYTGGWELKDNPCHELNLTKAPPRVRTWPVDGVRAMLAACDAAGKPSIGDAMMIALYSGQRENDVLALVDKVGSASTAHQVALGEPIELRQLKTGKFVAIFAAPDLVARLARAEERRAAIVAGRKVVPLNGELPIVMNSRGNAWFDGAFRKAFRTIRNRVAIERPELKIGDLHFQDLRDTAVTWLGNAECSIPLICSYTGHTLESATHILRHYMALNKDMARAASAKQIAWLEREGIKL